MDYVISLSTEIYLEQRNLNKALIEKGIPQNKLSINLNEFNIIWSVKQMMQLQKILVAWNLFQKFQDQQVRIKQTILMRPHKILVLEKNPEKRCDPKRVNPQERTGQAVLEIRSQKGDHREVRVQGSETGAGAQQEFQELFENELGGNIFLFERGKCEIEETRY